MKQTNARFVDSYDWGPYGPTVTGSVYGYPPETSSLHGHYYNGILRTSWGQDAYSSAVTAYNFGNTWSNGLSYKIGFDVIALAQIIAQHGKIRDNNYVNRTATPLKSYSSRGNVSTNKDRFVNETGSTILFSTINSYNWSDMKRHPWISSAYVPQTAKEQISVLIFQVGCKMDKYFSNNGGTLTPIEYVINALYEMGYATLGIQNFTTATTSLNGYFGVRRSIENGRPVYVQNQSNSYFTSTAWVIDNYQVVTVTDPYRQYLQYHCIVGQGNFSYDGWYDIYMLNNSSTRGITGAY